MTLDPDGFYTNEPHQGLSHEIDPFRERRDSFPRASRTAQPAWPAGGAWRASGPHPLRPLRAEHGVSLPAHGRRPPAAPAPLDPEEIMGDVSAQQRAEAQARGEREFSDRLIESLPGAFVLIDEDGRVLRWNANLERLIGYPPEEILGRQALEFVAEGDRDRTAAAMIEALQTGRADVEMRLLARDGSSRPFYMSGVAVERDGRRHVVVNGVDLSERRAIEAQLLHAQKMESIGRLAGGFAHDFNNMLVAVMSFAEILLMDMAEDDARRDDVQTIREAALRASDLTRQLLAFSRRQVLNPKPTNLNRLVGDLDKMLRRMIGDDVELVTLFGDGLGVVEVDAGQIESALINLAVNARDAMPDGGTLLIEVGNVELGPDGVGLHGPAVRLTVTDTGVGMSEEVRAQIFEPFFTTKEPDKGTGLGLASVYGIVQQSGGQIAVDSEPGRGTTFTIDLPRVGQSAAATEEIAARAAEGGTETILVVDDNDLVRRGVAAMLRAHGFTVIEAVSGDAALETVRRGSSAIDLILADIVMPGMSTEELCEHLAELLPSARTILMSGYTDGMASLTNAAVRNASFIQKPFTPDVLVRCIREALDGPPKVSQR